MTDSVEETWRGLTPSEDRDKAIDDALEAVLRLAADAELQQSLRDQNQADSVLNTLHLPASARPQLLNVVNRLEQRRAAEHHEQAVGEDVEKLEIRRTLLESYGHIRWSFWTLFGMSVTLFIVGLAFLGVAMFRSINEGSVSSATLTIAGLGVADMVIIFYARPWQDIAKNLANSQRARFIATSYLAALALIQQGRDDQFRLLERLTRESIALLGDARSSRGDQQVTEDEGTRRG